MQSADAKEISPIACGREEVLVGLGLRRPARALGGGPRARGFNPEDDFRDLYGPVRPVLAGSTGTILPTYHTMR